MSLAGTKLELVTTFDEAAAFKRWLGERHENNAIAIDTETTGLNPRDTGAAVRLIQIGDTQQGWSIPWLDWRGLALEAMTQFDGTLITHNGAFEMKWIHEHSPYRLPRARTVDTMIGAHIINPLGSGALKQLSTKYVDPKAGAGQNILHEAFAENGWDWATVPVTFEPYWTYAALDTVLTAQLWDVFKPQLTSDVQGRVRPRDGSAVRRLGDGGARRAGGPGLLAASRWTGWSTRPTPSPTGPRTHSASTSPATPNSGATLIEHGGELFDFTADRASRRWTSTRSRSCPTRRTGTRRRSRCSPSRRCIVRGQPQVRIDVLLQLPDQERGRLHPRRHPHPRGAHRAHVGGPARPAAAPEEQRAGPQCVHPPRGQRAGHHRLLPDRDAPHGRGVRGPRPAGGVPHRRCHGR